MGIKFVRQKLDFHAYDFLDLEVASYNPAQNKRNKALFQGKMPFFKRA